MRNDRKNKICGWMDGFYVNMFDFLVKFLLESPTNFSKMIK